MIPKEIEFLAFRTEWHPGGTKSDTKPTPKPTPDTTSDAHVTRQENGPEKSILKAAVICGLL